MTTSPSSGLSAEAKEFIPLISSSTNIPLYVDENTVASIYPSDHQPLMVQAIYPMMISNSKGTDNLAFPEIEFHIQPSQQQQFQIDSCSNLSQSPISVTNGNSSAITTTTTTTTVPPTNTSQIVLLPATNSASGFYPVPPPILYSPNDAPLQAYYPVEYCEPSLINFSLHQPNLTSKSSRISSQQTRANAFRSNHGSYRSSSRGNNRGNNINRNNYYDYSNRRNGSSGRGNPSMNKRISSSAYHSQDYNNYYQTPASSRSRGYASRSNINHDDYRKEQLDYYHSEKDFYDNEFPPTNQLNDDGTPFEFRPEDFPSLPNNPNQQSDKSSTTEVTHSTNPKPISSWNTIVSSNPPRPHSTSPQPIPPAQESRSDRSRSFNIKSTNQIERKSSSTTTTTTAKKSSLHQPSPVNRASKLEDSSKTSKSDLPLDEKNNLDDGFMQTKQQHRRLKRRHKIKEESSSFTRTGGGGGGDDDDNNDIVVDEEHPTSTSLTDTFNSLAISSSIKHTDTNPSEQQSTRLSSSSNNSSDTSDYDDAVDNFDAE